MFLRMSLFSTNSCAFLHIFNKSKRSWCTCIMATWFSLCWLIEFLRYVFKCHKHEKLLSASALLAGIVSRSFKSCLVWSNIDRTVGSNDWNFFANVSMHVIAQFWSLNICNWKTSRSEFSSGYDRTMSDISCIVRCVNMTLSSYTYCFTPGWS